MTHKTPDGFTILLPDMDVQALANTSRAHFVQELLTKNPTLPATLLTKQTLLCCVMGRIARLGQEYPFSAESKAQIKTIHQRWVSSTAGDVLHELFDGKLPRTGAHLPSSVPTACTSLSNTQESSNTTAPIVTIPSTNLQAVEREPPATAPSLPKPVDPNQSFSGSTSMSYNGNVVVHMAQFLGQDYRKNLIQDGNSLLVSLPFETGHALPSKTTHAHLFDHTDQAGSLRRIQLVMACYRSIVLAYDSKAHKDLAARQVESLKFQFEDDDPIKLDVQEFSESPASAKATYTLGSGPLYFCDDLESLQRFFCREGSVPIKDIIRTRRSGVLRIQVLIRYRFCPGFMEKLTALPGGHRDNQIPAQPAASCSLCQHTTDQDRLQSSPKDALQPNVKPRFPPSGNGGANLEISARRIWKVPGPELAAAHPSLDDLKITSYIAVFTLRNGVEATKKVPPRLLVRGFNQFLDAFYPDTDLEARLAVLHRIDGSERVGDWELFFEELRRCFTIEYMSSGAAVSSKRQSLADDDKAVRKRPKRAVAADYM